MHTHTQPQAGARSRLLTVSGGATFSINNKPFSPKLLYTGSIRSAMLICVQNTHETDKAGLVYVFSQTPKTFTAFSVLLLGSLAPVIVPKDPSNFQARPAPGGAPSPNPPGHSKADFRRLLHWRGVTRQYRANRESHLSRAFPPIIHYMLNYMHMLVAWAGRGQCAIRMGTAVQHAERCQS